MTITVHLFISRQSTVIVVSHRMHYVDFNEFALQRGRI